MNVKKRKRARQLARVQCDTARTWLGDDESYAQYRASVERMQTADLSMFGGWKDDEDQEDEEIEFGGQYSYMLSRHGDTAVLQVYGDLVPKESWFNRYFGMVSYEEIRNAAIMAAEGGAKALLLDFDTGGGAVTGIGELSDFLKEFDSNVMPVYSYTGANMLSAGYWLGSVGRKVYAGPMALSGSIGVITAHFSYYRAMKEQGIDVTMFRQGEFKALGSPYEQLDDKAKADIEARMGKFYGMFLGHVSEQRGMTVQALIDTAAEGRVFVGADAVSVGLVDAITSFDKVVAMLNAGIKAQQPAIPVQTQTTMAGTTDMKRKLTEAGLAAVSSGITIEAALIDPALSEDVLEDEQPTPAAEDEQPAPEVTEQEGEQPTPAAAAPAAQPTLDAGTVDRLIAMSGELATLKAENATLKLAATEREAHFKSMMKIVGDAVNRMELAMNRGQTNFKDASAETVLNTYHSTLSAFNSQFKVGGVAEVPSGEDLGSKPSGTLYVPDQSAVSL